MRNFGKRLSRALRRDKVGTYTEPQASASGHATEAVMVRNPYHRVAVRIGDELRIRLPQKAKVYGLLTRSETLDEIETLLPNADINLADMRFAVLDHDSWVDLQLWTKRFLADVGYRYVGDRRDCNAHARIMRTAFDLLGSMDLPGSPMAGGIYAHMDEPFAGVADSYHALNLSRTDRGGFVSEPQGLHLHYQRVEAWAQTRRITHVFSD